METHKPSIHPTVGELIELAKERPIRVVVPFTSDMDKDLRPEEMRRHVENMIEAALAEWVETNA